MPGMTHRPPEWRQYQFANLSSVKIQMAKIYSILGISSKMLSLFVYVLAQITNICCLVFTTITFDIMC